MSLTHSQTSDIERDDVTDPYLPVEEIARRLDLPLGVLLRRVEAGEFPARRQIGSFGVRYSLRLSDLGVDPQPANAAEPDAAHDGETNGRLNVVGNARQWSGGETRAVQEYEPRSDVASMSLDARELVAGLLDRWERTLEQRIYAEQRIRFEAELNARQNLVKQLQLELDSSRAQQAAAMADRDRKLAENERRNIELQQELAAAREAASKRRGIFRR